MSNIVKLLNKEFLYLVSKGFFSVFLKFSRFYSFKFDVEADEDDVPCVLSKADIVR